MVVGKGQARVEKIDFKKDFRGTFCSTQYKLYHNRFIEALQQGVNRLNNMDDGLEIQSDLRSNEQDPEALRILKGFNNCHTLLSANIISGRQINYGIKRYDKVSELVQKNTVGQSIGSRVGRLVGEPW